MRYLPPNRSGANSGAALGFSAAPISRRRFLPLWLSLTSDYLYYPLGSIVRMKLRQQKGKFAIGAIVMLTLVIISLRSSSHVSVTYLHSTNDPQRGKVGVFQIVNQLDETVRIGSGYYLPAKRKGLNAQKGDWGADIGGLHTFAAQSTNVLQIWSPTNGGPYKLVLQCLPASKTTSQFHGSIRVRIVSLLSPWVNPSFVTQARWYGSIFAESQSFEITP